VVLADQTNQLGGLIDQAINRGARVIVICPRNSAVIDFAAGSNVRLIEIAETDLLTSAIVALEQLHAMRLGPAISSEDIASGIDRVAEDCSPQLDLGQNPAKDLACMLADDIPLFWGYTPLAHCAALHGAEAIRQASRRIALAGDREMLTPLIVGATDRDIFADPFDEQVANDVPRPCLVILREGGDNPLTEAAEGDLRQLARTHEVRVTQIDAWQGDAVERYTTVLFRCLYAAVYLEVGLI
jgi:hypothetical protein